MNAFTDLHATVGSARIPTHRRLGNPWTEQLCIPGKAWIGGSRGPRAASVAHAEGPGWSLWATGELFSYRSDPERPLERFAKDLADGRPSPAALDAHAVIFGWEVERRRLHVWTDRLGTVHAYASSAAGSASVGTVFGAVREHRRGGVDWVGVSAFCAFGFYPGDRTMHEDVRILRPATWTVLDTLGRIVSSRSYWEWTYRPSASRTVPDILDEFHDIWTRTIRNQTRERAVVIPVSGGLDSRTVLAGTTPEGQAGGLSRVAAMTYGYRQGSVETSIAKRVAAAHGLEASAFVIEPYLFDRIHEISGAVEGFQALSFSRQVGASEEIAARGDYVVGGHWGDVWFDRAGVGGSGSLVDVATQKLARPGGEWLLEHVCAPHLDGEPPHHVLRELLSAELARLPDLEDREMEFKALKTEQWSFRWTLASIRAYQLGVPTLMPFYANEVVDFFLRVPTAMHGGRRLQKEYLRRYHPALAAVTWQQTGMSLEERPWEPARALAMRGYRRLRSVVSHRRTIERNWEVQYLAGAGPQRLRAALLRPDRLDAVGMNGSTMGRLVDGFLEQPDRGRGYAVDAVLTLATALADRSDQVEST